MKVLITFRQPVNVSIGLWAHFVKTSSWYADNGIVFLGCKPSDFSHTATDASIEAYCYDSAGDPEWRNTPSMIVPWDNVAGMLAIKDDSNPQ